MRLEAKFSKTSPSSAFGQPLPLAVSFAITERLQVPPNRGVEFLGLGHLLVEFSGKLGHLLLKGHAVVLDLLGSDIAAGGEDVAVGFDLLERGALAEAGDVLVLA